MLEVFVVWVAVLFGFSFNKVEDVVNVFATGILFLAWHPVSAIPSISTWLEIFIFVNVFTSSPAVT